MNAFGHKISDGIKFNMFYIAMLRAMRLPVSQLISVIHPLTTDEKVLFIGEADIVRDCFARFVELPFVDEDIMRLTTKQIAKYERSFRFWSLFGNRNYLLHFALELATLVTCLIPSVQLPKSQRIAGAAVAAGCLYLTGVFSAVDRRRMHGAAKNCGLASSLLQGYLNGDEAVAQLVKERATKSDPSLASIIADPIAGDCLGDIEKDVTSGATHRVASEVVDILLRQFDN